MEKIAILHYGCPKNLIDTELMAGFLIKEGYQITLDENESEIVIINTCSFIHDAEKESVQAILKSVLSGKKVIVAGCLAQKYKEKLKELIPEIKGIIGISDIKNVVNAVKSIKEEYFKISEPLYCYPEEIERAQITVGSSAYIKIAEGCNCNCGYCIIPKLRGKYVSRSIENIVKEAQTLCDKGVSEIILIAQDTTSYGIDLYGKPSLSELLRKLNNIKNLGWLRIMYTYPSFIDNELLKAINSLEHVVKYIDIPLQHSHQEMLSMMLRPKMDYEKLINNIRQKVDNVTLRTTFIVGYPTETEEHFKHLYNFIEKIRFDRLGIFEYSRETGTYSYDLKPRVSNKTKRLRKKELMALQSKISYNINSNFIGNEMEVLLETVTNSYSIGRSQRDAPEVDGLVYVESKELLTPGEFIKIRITKNSEHDLYGKI